MRRPDSSRTRLSVCRLLLAAALSATATSCYSSGQGKEIPLDQIYFPVGLTLAEDNTSLVVVNSDFDLQYSSGTLQVIDAQLLAQQVGAVRDCIEQGGLDCCGEFNSGQTDPSGIQELATQLLYPGLCGWIDPAHSLAGQAVFRSKVRIGAFGTDVIYRALRNSKTGEPLNEGRLFVPVRGDSTLHWATLLNGQIYCGQGTNRDQACNDYHRAGNSPDQENTRDLKLGPEPYELDASQDGSAVLVSNQTTGQVSLFLQADVDAYGNVPSQAAPAGDDDPSTAPPPSLQFAVTGLPSRPIGIAALPIPALAWTQPLAGDPDVSRVYSSGFLVTYRNAPRVDLIRVLPDSDSQTRRPYAALVGASGITVNSNGSDSRGIAVDDSARRSVELACATSVGVPAECLEQYCPDLSADARSSLATCLAQADTTQLDVFVANRTPASLLVGRMVPAVNNFYSSEVPAFYDTVPLTNGPARVAVGQVTVGHVNGSPLLETRVFVSCFDSRRVFVYDPIRRRLETEIFTGRGPHALAVDSKNALLYIGFFTDSYIGAVSLDQSMPRTYGKVIASVGVPTVPRTSK